jgi:CPA1 family monovalent cation:H+ antiporter
LIWVSASLVVSLADAHWHGTRRTHPPWRLVAALSLAGVRGAITMAGVMTLPLSLPDGAAFPARDLTIFLAAAVILLSLSIAAIGLPRLLKGLQLPTEPAEHREEDRARREAAAAAIAAVDKARQDLPHETSDVEVYTNAAARVIALYQRRLDGSDSGTFGAAELRKADEAERALRLAAFRAEREKLFDMARHYQLSDETSRKLVREIDLMETRYR